MIRVFAVRCINDKSPVGIFLAHSITDLMFQVDEHMNPDFAEYKPIENEGGIVWPDDTYPWKMGVDQKLKGSKAEKRFDDVMAGAHLSGSLADVLMGDTNIRLWKKFKEGVVDAVAKRYGVKAA